MNLIKKLNRIQTELNAPKDAFNSFGKYTFRGVGKYIAGSRAATGGDRLSADGFR